MTVRHDGCPTISHPGSDKPRIVREIIETDSTINVPAEEMFTYAAWRAFQVLRERLDASPSLQTREQFIAVVDELATTYEGLYRATAAA